MKQLFRDTRRALARDASALLGFPWSKPTEPSTRASTSSGFVATITDTDREAMFERNQTAHAIIEDVAKDAVLPFTCTLKDETLEQFTADAILIFNKLIAGPLTRALLFTRLHGYAGILIGYADGKTLAEEVSPSSQILYLQPIPKSWIKEMALKKDSNGDNLLPLELDYYEINIGNSTKKIDASRLIHFKNPSLKEESLEGQSVLDCIFDDLTSLKSITWGAGQAMWRSGGGLIVFVAPDSTDPQAQIDAIDELVTDINAMTVLTMPPGTKVYTGTPGALNPKEYFDTCLQMISIGTRIPMSILRGSVAGTLTASEKDRKDYYELIDNIQKEHLTPALMNILRRLQASGQLSAQKDFIIEWETTPIWMLEEQRGRKLQAETKLIEAKIEELLATVPGGT